MEKYSAIVNYVKFILALLLFLAPLASSNPAGHSLTLTEPNLK